MIDVLLAHTVEVDDIDLAVNIFLAQLNLNQNLKRHSVGIIHCSDVFIHSGVTKAMPTDSLFQQWA
jgi:hypothetical protein